MVVTDSFLTNMAKALNSESFTVPTHNVVATDVPVTLGTSSTTLSGIIGTGESASNSRDNRTVTWSSIRSSTSVVDQVNGDDLQAVGLFDASLGGILQVGVPITELHTTSFDLEFIWDISVKRGS